MPDKVEMYDGEYGNYDSDVYRQVRTETYGVDFGQTSWVTTEESAEIPNWLALTNTSRYWRLVADPVCTPCTLPGRSVAGSPA